MLPNVCGHGGLQILVQSWRISVVPVEHSSHLGALEFFMVANLNPLSSRSVVETCVMSILLFGSECWYLSDPT